jgi:hypothetical protein
MDELNTANNTLIFLFVPRLQEPEIPKLYLVDSVLLFAACIAILLNVALFKNNTVLTNKI